MPRVHYTTLQDLIAKILYMHGGVRNIVDAPWYSINADLHRDHQMEMVTSEMGKFAKKHEERLLRHVNVEAFELLDNGN
jgi:hypothetical protein